MVGAQELLLHPNQSVGSLATPVLLSWDGYGTPLVLCGAGFAENTWKGHGILNRPALPSCANLIFGTPEVQGRVLLRQE